VAGSVAWSPDATIRKIVKVTNIIRGLFIISPPARHLRIVQVTRRQKLHSLNS
jgi:hypothetical protein